MKSFSPKLIFLGVSLFLILMITATLLKINHDEPITDSYQGPVPEGYDEDYFRMTGLTPPETVFEPVCLRIKTSGSIL